MVGVKNWEEYSLNGKITLITGGSSGIGQKIAQFLLSKGCRVIITSSNKDKLEKSYNKLKNEFPDAEINNFVCDIIHNSQIDNLVDFLNQNNLVPQVLINCAAILGPLGLFEENDFEKWKNTIHINLIGNALMIKKLMPLLIKTKNSKIINFGGGGAANSRPFHSAYACSKAAMVRLTEILADEYKHKMDINIVAPGAHKTKMWEEENYDAEPDNWADENKLFGLISFLISSKSDGITGRFIHIENDWQDFTAEISNTERFLLRRTN